MNFDCANVNIKSRKQKREPAGTFVDFKKLESPTDDGFDIDSEAFLHSFHDDNEVIKCLFPTNVDPIETVLDLPYIARDSFFEFTYSKRIIFESTS